MKINFRLKKQAKGKNAYIYCRIHLNGVDATDFLTYVKFAETWNQADQLFIGKDNETKTLNDTLNAIKDDLKLLYKQLKRAGEINANDLRNTYVKQAECKTLIDIYTTHYKTVVKRLGQPGYLEGTRKAHKSLDTIIKKFLKYKKRTDINLLDIRLGFGKEFIDFLRDTRSTNKTILFET